MKVKAEQAALQMHGRRHFKIGNRWPIGSERDLLRARHHPGNGIQMQRALLDGVADTAHLYPQDTPHANLLLTLLNRGGIDLPELGNSTGQLTEI